MKNKKTITFIVALIIGISYCPLETTALSRYNEKQPENTSSENLERLCLQIPEKLEIMIDPLEINGKGQIYSNQYIIKNSGSKAGTLILSDFVCQPQKNSGAIIKTNNMGIHDDREKSVYVEAVFGNGDKVVFSQPDAKYEIKLNSNEELLLTFSGEVNENASRKWEDNDVIVSMVYSWSIDQSASGELDQQKLKETINKNEEEILPVLIEAELIKNEVIESQKGLENIFDEKSEDKQVRENQSLQIPEKMEIIVDPFEVTGKGQIYSEQYIIRNSGDAAGKLSLFDFKCNLQENSGIRVKADKTGIHGNEEKSIYLEIVFEDGNKVILSRPDTRYEVKLGAGEELYLAFSGEVNENADEKWKNNEINVSLSYLWNLEESTSNENTMK